MLAEAEREVRHLDRAQRVEAVRGRAERRLVAVARRVEHHEVVALGDRDATDLVSQRRGAGELLDRRDPAEALLDRDRDRGSDPRRARPAGRDARPSAIIPPEMRCRVVSFPATSNDMLNVTSSAAVSGRPSTSAPHEQRDDVVARVRPPCRARAARGTRRAPSRRAARPAGARRGRRTRGSWRRTSAGSRSGSASGTPSRSQITSTGSGAASTSTRSTTSPAGTASSSRTRQRPDLVLHALDGARGELAVEDAPPGAVLRRVHVQDRPVDGPALAQRVVDERAPPRAERLRVAADLTDVVVAGHRLDPRRVLEHRRLGAQPGEHLVVVGPEEEPRRRRVDARGRRARSSARHRSDSAMRRARMSSSGLSASGSIGGARRLLLHEREPGHDRSAAHHREVSRTTRVDERAARAALRSAPVPRRGRGSPGTARPNSSFWIASSARYHATSCSGGPIVVISQSSTATGRRSSSKMTLPSRTSPHSNAGGGSAQAGARHTRSSASTSPGTMHRRRRRTSRGSATSTPAPRRARDREDARRARRSCQSTRWIAASTSKKPSRQRRAALPGPSSVIQRSRHRRLLGHVAGDRRHHQELRARATRGSVSSSTGHRGRDAVRRDAPPAPAPAPRGRTPGTHRGPTAPAHDERLLVVVVTVASPAGVDHQRVARQPGRRSLATGDGEVVDPAPGRQPASRCPRPTASRSRCTASVIDPPGSVRRYRAYRSPTSGGGSPRR